MGQRSEVKSITVGPTVASELLPLRAERDVAWIYNVVGTLYFKFGPGASETSFTGRLQANEMSPPIYRYNGPISAIKASGSTVVYVTECWQ